MNSSLYNSAFPVFRLRRLLTVLWSPAKMRKCHFCAECRQEIGKGSIAYKPDTQASVKDHRICAACANDLIKNHKVIVV